LKKPKAADPESQEEDADKDEDTPQEETTKQDQPQEEEEDLTPVYVHAGRLFDVSNF
jgi:hypothetical protein